MPNRVLVVGASGQLGTAAVMLLVEAGVPVRAAVRTREQAERLQRIGAEAAWLDLTDRASLAQPCTDVSAIIATANAAVPTRRSDTFRKVDGAGYRHLIDVARNAGVRRFVYASAFQPRIVPASEFLQCKRATEEYLEASGMEAVIFRAGPFMDVAFAMMGSGVPVAGVEGATALRPFWFSFSHFRRNQLNISKKRVALIPGDGRKRHCFICVDDVAKFLVAGVQSERRGVWHIGGPEALTMLDVVRIYEELLGYSIRPRHTPAFVFRILSTGLRPFSPAAANLMTLNAVAATEDYVVDSSAAATAFGVGLTSARTFLASKLQAGGIATVGSRS